MVFLQELDPQINYQEATGGNLTITRRQLFGLGFLSFDMMMGFVAGQRGLNYPASLKQQAEQLIQALDSLTRSGSAPVSRSRNSISSTDYIPPQFNEALPGYPAEVGDFHLPGGVLISPDSHDIWYIDPYTLRLTYGHFDKYVPSSWTLPPFENPPNIDIRREVLTQPTYIGEGQVVFPTWVLDRQHGRDYVICNVVGPSSNKRGLIDTGQMFFRPPAVIRELGQAVAIGNQNSAARNGQAEVVFLNLKDARVSRHFPLSPGEYLSDSQSLQIGRIDPGLDQQQIGFFSSSSEGSEKYVIVDNQGGRKELAGVENPQQVVLADTDADGLHEVISSSGSVMRITHADNQTDNWSFDIAELIGDGSPNWRINSIAPFQISACV